MFALLLCLAAATTTDTLDLSLRQALDLALRQSPARAQASASRLESGIKI